MPETKKIEVSTRGPLWLQLKWLIVSVAVVLIAVGVVNLGITIFKSTLSKYPVEQFKFESPRVAPDGESKVAEKTDEEKQQEKDREQEARLLAEINDYGKSVGQFLAGLGLLYVYLLIIKSEREHGRN